MTDTDQIKRKRGRPRRNDGDVDCDNVAVVRKRSVYQDNTREGWWKVRLKVGGKDLYLGSFPTRTEAFEVFDREVEKLGIKKTYLDGPPDLFSLESIQAALAQLYYEIHEGLIRDSRKTSHLVSCLKLAADLVKSDQALLERWLKQNPEIAKQLGDENDGYSNSEGDGQSRTEGAKGGDPKLGLQS